jgi:hypothetical protein
VAFYAHESERESAAFEDHQGLRRVTTTPPRGTGWSVSPSGLRSAKDGDSISLGAGAEDGHYSCCSTMTGVMVAALIAGMSMARRAVPPSKVIVPRYVPTSHGLIS